MTRVWRAAAGNSGGAGGIRTLDTAFQPYNGLANRRLQPLGHSSVQRRPDECPAPGRHSCPRFRAASRVARTFRPPGASSWKPGKARAAARGKVFLLRQDRGLFATAGMRRPCYRSPSAVASGETATISFPFRIRSSTSRHRPRSRTRSCRRDRNRRDGSFLSRRSRCDRAGRGSANCARH